MNKEITYCFIREKNQWFTIRQSDLYMKKYSEETHNIPNERREGKELAHFERLNVCS